MKLRAPMVLLVWCCYVVLTPRVADGVMVIRFQEDRVARNDTMAWYEGGIDPTRELQSVTLCARFFLFTHHGKATVFMLSNAYGDDGILEADIWLDRVRPVLARSYNYQILKKKLWAYRWHHLCFVYDHILERISTYVDGSLNNHQEKVTLAKTMSGNGACIGQGLYFAQRSISGDLSQINVWDRPLIEEEVKRLAGCKEDMLGNYVSWEGGWKLEKVTSYDIPLADLCKQQGSMYFWFRSKPFKTSMYLCRALGSRLPSATDLEEIDTMFRAAHAQFPPTDSCYTDHWTALNDIKEEGVWRIENTIIENIPWAPLEPNGLHYDNCVSLGQFGPWDVNCNTNVKCVVCLFKEQHRFAFLGTCESEPRNVYFMAFQYKVDELHFVGYGAYEIKEEKSGWVWVNNVKNTVIAYMEDTAAEYPMGRRWWRLNQTVCGQPRGEMRRLLLTPCAQDEFTCNDGTCVPLHQRCDLKYDCRDDSDEVECQTVAIPDGYQKHLPPRNETDPQASLNLATFLSLESIGVNTLGMTMEVSFKMIMTWVDNRLSYLNLKVNDSLNIVPMTTVEKMWTPELSFTNTKDNKHSIIDGDTTMLIIRQAKPVGRDEAAAAEVDNYAGESNSVKIERKYGTEFTCDFDLVLYPFDKQECFMRFRITSASQSFLIFDQAASHVLNFANTLLLEYEVGSLYLAYDESDDEFSEMMVVVPLTRRYGYAILNIYLPTLVLLIVNYTTLFIRPIIFDVRMMAALTVQLVIATLFSQVSESLPKTAYFKMVDVWFIFCIIITFVTIIFHVLVDEAVNSPMNIVTPSATQKAFNAVGCCMGSGGSGGSVRLLNGMTKMLQGRKTVVATKLAVLLAFILFNVCYWGYILS